MTDISRDLSNVTKLRTDEIVLEARYSYPLFISGLDVAQR